MSICSASICSESTASLIGTCWLLSRIIWSAPSERSSWIISIFPSLAAMCNGVRLSWEVLALTLAPFSMSREAALNLTRSSH